MRKQSSSLVGLVLLTLLVLGYVGLTRQQRVVTSEQAATVTATETAGCLRQTHDCVTATLLGYTHHGDGTTTLRYRITNDCSAAVTTVAIETGHWTRVVPVAGAAYSGELGTYSVTWIEQAGEILTQGIRFASDNAAYRDGASEHFTIRVRDFVPESPNTLHISTVARSHSFRWMLLDPTCEVGVDPTPRPLPTATATITPTATLDPAVSTATLAYEPTPIHCLRQTHDCVTATLLGYTHHGDGTTTLRYRITNDCSAAVTTVAIETGHWTRVAPVAGAAYSGELGTYSVTWIEQAGEILTQGIRFASDNAAYRDGASEQFTIRVRDFVPESPNTLHISTVARSHSFRWMLLDPTCEVGVDPTPRPLPTATATITPTPTPTSTPTSIPTMTATPTATATQPESPLPTPTRTPLAPPPPPVATPTAIPLVVPQDNRGTLYYAADTTSSTTLYALETDATGHPISEPTPVPLDRYGPIDDLFASPDGRYLVTSYDTLAQVLEIFDRQTGAPQLIITPKIFFGWHPDSQHLLVRTDADPGYGVGLWRVNLLTGEKSPLVLQEGKNPSWSVNGAAISPNGQTLAYATGGGVWLAYPNGNTQEKRINASDVWAWSFDGRYLLYSGQRLSRSKGENVPRYALWVLDTVTDERKPILGTFLYGYGFRPVLSPATQEVAFVGYLEPDDCFRKDETRRADPFCKYRGFSLFVADLATGESKRIADNVGTPAWSPDGSAIAYPQLQQDEQLDLWISYLADDQHMQLTDTAATEQAVLWLPE